jgi:uncharacterized damage-inducible protein DinB
VKKNELYQALNHSRERLLRAIEGLDATHLTQPGAVGIWSVKDVLAHLAMWEAQTVTLLYQVRQGMKPTTLHLKTFDTDQQNAQWYEQAKDRPWEQVWADFQGVRVQTLRRLDAFNEDELSSPTRFPWLGMSLADLVYEWVVQHEEDHAADLETWRQRLEG